MTYRKFSLVLLLAPVWTTTLADMVLREDTAAQTRQIGPFVDNTGAVLTALTISNTDVMLSKHGAAAVAKNSGGCTHDVNGMYLCTFDATDASTVGSLQITVNESGALPVYHEFQVAEESVYDACCAPGASPQTFPANFASLAITGGGAVTAGTVSDKTGYALSSTQTFNNTGTWTGSLTGTVGTVTTLTNLPSIPANWITAAGINSDAFTAAKFASDVGTEFGTATWASTTRLLTAGTNIVLAKGTGITGFNDLSTAQVNSEVDTALSDIHLDHLLAVDYDPSSKPGVATALLNELVENDGGVARFTANALEQGPAGGGGGVADWTVDERTAIRAILGVPGSGTTPADPTTGILDTTRDLVTDVPTNGELGTALAGADDATLAAIAGLNNLSSAQAQTATTAALDAYDPPTNTEMIAALASADDATLAAISALNNLSIAQVRSIVIEDQGDTVDLGCVNAVALAVLAGRASVSGDTVTYRDPSNGEIRAVITHDSSGNRTASTITCPTY